MAAAHQPLLQRQEHLHPDRRQSAVWIAVVRNAVVCKDSSVPLTHVPDAERLHMITKTPITLDRLSLLLYDECVSSLVWHTGRVIA